MEKHKKLVRVVCLVLAALMVMTIGVPLIFAYAETPAEKLERLRKELEDIKSNISAVENSKEKSEQTKQYYQAQANNLKAQLAAIKEDIAAQQQSIELKNAEVAEKAANVAYNKSMFESRLKGMYEMSRQSNLAILLGIDDVSQMLLFAENLQQISEHDTQLVQQLRDEQAALEAQLKYLELINGLFLEVNPIPVKAALNMMGWEVGPCRMPLYEMSEGAAAKLRTALEKAGLVQ